VIPILAQLEAVNPNWGWTAVLFLVGVIGITTSIVQAANGRRAQKRDVTLMEDFATRRELNNLAEKVESKFEALRGELQELRGEMQEDKNEIVKSGETRVVKLHDRINEVLSAVSELRGEVHARFDK
jgi:predicted nuclease with TOPRIM domain